ncbi:Kynureninase (L-kynurenine hydrolase) [Tulasnella sp. 424]|nr:Kynureninase (L-kynurenine hydrolase) [Tulasnella sp. 424]KAG8978469.1 Kynureninase (L-kynurenine hydrolase) [Tulasnella sp. 425]
MSTIEEVIGLKALDPGLKAYDPKAATLLDEHDPLKEFRKEFKLPTNKGIKATAVQDDLQDEPCVYFVGNSLGPLSKRSQELLNEELDIWASVGVTGHFDHPMQRDWMTLASKATKLLSPIVGAKEEEIAVMGTLTANLHLMMSSFYKPTKERYKILCEIKPFPSDEYAFASQAALHGFDPTTAVVHLQPRANEHSIRTSDILDAIKEHSSSLALVLLSGVQYYTGQYFAMPEITKAAHDAGALCGWDLAHAVGNVPLKLHDWDVDFAVWCTYKYLNSGPGGIGGLFVHEKWHKEKGVQYAGWWGHDEATRFQMPPVFQPIPGAQGFQQSNPSILNIASLLGSLEVFSRVHPTDPMSVIREKSIRATAYLETLLRSCRFFVGPHDGEKVLKGEVLTGADKPMKGAFTIITPRAKDERGAQLSLLFSEEAMPKVFNEMVKRGVIGDERHPGIIRFAPAPLYCSFEDVRKCVATLVEVLNSL